MRPQARTDAQTLLAHAGWMRALAYGLLRDPGAADDVVQDATLAALLHAPAGDAELAPWLSRVVRNFVARRRRGEARRSEHEGRAAPRRPEPSPAETVERLDLQRTLVDAVLAIEEPLRTTLVLRYFEGKSSAEIARLQGIPAGTVRWRLQRGLQALRERLDARAGSRASWALVLAPFAARPAAATSVGVLATGSKFLIGVMAMKAVQVAAATVAVLLVGGAAWWGFAGSRAAADIDTAAPTPPTTERASARLDPLALPAGELVQDAEGLRAVVDVEAAPLAQAPASAASTTSPIASVDARFVDEHGTPWSGVLFAPRPVKWLSNWKPVESTLSDADGRATLRIELPAKRPRNAGSGGLHIELLASREGCATVRRAATLSEGEIVHLGDIVLGPGVRILGRSVDERGNALAQVELGVTAPELSGDEARMRRHGSLAFQAAPSAHSAADGSFVLDGVARGTLRVWAHVEGRRFAWSAPIDASADRDVSGIELVLEPLNASDRIEGRVLAPDGTPIANAQLWVQERSRGSGTATSRPVDSEGRFRLLVEHDDSVYGFMADDPLSRFATTAVEGIRPGDLAVEIRMQEKRWLTLRVRTLEGEPVPDARFDITARGLGGAVPSSSVAPGDYLIAIPDGSFWLEVEAPGFRGKHLGELDSAKLGATLDVALQRAPSVRGRVLADGAPKPGVLVQLLADDPGTTMTVCGYRQRYVVFVSTPSVVSDAQGRFRIDCDEDHGFWLRASAEGWAPGEVGPLDATQLSADSEFEIEITRGGAIEGFVRLPDGREGEGTIVALNHGDGFPRTLRAGPKGAFRAEGLAPGKWQVLEAPAEIDPAVTSYASSRSDAPIEWSCEVRAGQTTRFDLDLTKP